MIAAALLATVAILCFIGGLVARRPVRKRLGQYDYTIVVTVDASQAKAQLDQIQEAIATMAAQFDGIKVPAPPTKIQWQEDAA